MKAEHQRWISEATRLSHAKHFAEAHQLANMVLSEDEKNPEALWLVATMTHSLHERRWALNALLRIQPKNFQAQELFNSTSHKAEHIAPSVHFFPCAPTNQCDEWRA